MSKWAGLKIMGIGALLIAVSVMLLEMGVQRVGGMVFMLGWLVVVAGIGLGNIWLIRHRAEWRADLEGKGPRSADSSREERRGPE